MGLIYWIGKNVKGEVLFICGETGRVNDSDLPGGRGVYVAFNFVLIMMAPASIKKTHRTVRERLSDKMS
jgi:hypothetical protein